jgi:signal transduction histidine kinase
MKRRLTISILLAVAAALLLAGVGTLILARFGARQATEDDLRGQVSTTADLIALGQQRIGQLTASDAQVIRASLCKNTNDRAGIEVQQLRLALCAPPSTSVEETQAQVCAPLPARIQKSLGEEMRKARDAFCANPTAGNLDKMKQTYCSQGKRALCTLFRSRTLTGTELESTLSKESIVLVVFDHDGNLVQGELPDELTGASLQPARLREGETVVGPVSSGFFGAAAIDPTADELNVIVISRPVDPVRGLIPWFLLASGVTLLIGVVVANSLSRKLTQPLRDATAVTAQIADGNLAVRLPEHGVRPDEPKDELDELAHSINTMAEALERSRGLERQFLLSVSHDLRTPLTSIRGYAEAIADGAAPDAPRAAGIILAESRRLERLVKDLLDLAKLDARRFTLHSLPIDLNEVADDSVEGFRREVEAAGLHLAFVGAAAPTPAFADPDRLQQVIANLIENALKFADATITVRVVGDADGPRIEVEDDGPGFSPEVLPHVFERLYVATARPQRKEAGSGLGLAIVRELVEAMGGRVDAAPSVTGSTGTRMIVTMPPAAAAPPSQPT